MLRPDNVHLSTNSQNVSQVRAAQPGSSQSAVSEPNCKNCGRAWQKCLDGRPVYRNRVLSDLAPFSVMSCGPYWGKAKRGCVGTVVEVVGNSKSAKGQRVLVKWESGKTAKYPLTFTDALASGEPIFNFKCKICSNCRHGECRHGTPLTSVKSIPAEALEGEGFRVEAVGSYWGKKKKGLKGKIVELCPFADDAVRVVWDDEPDPAKSIRYRLISNLSHAKNVHIFNMSCF